MCPPTCTLCGVATTTTSGTVAVTRRAICSMARWGCHGERPGVLIARVWTASSPWGAITPMDTVLSITLRVAVHRLHASLAAVRFSHNSDHDARCAQPCLNGQLGPVDV
jgi:hypothetical protein